MFQLEQEKANVSVQRQSSRRKYLLLRGGSVFLFYLVLQLIRWDLSTLGKAIYFTHFTNLNGRASLVAQWLRIRLPMQGTWVRALVREDPTCRGATKPVCHNYWACTLEPASHNYWAHVPQLLKPVYLEPVLRNKRSHHNEIPAHRKGE